MRKRLLSTLLALCIVLALLPVTTHAADVNYAVTGGNLHFDVMTGTITGCDKTITEAVIPSEIYGVSVTSIGEYAFYKCTSLISVTIPNSVTVIKDEAFSLCTSLTRVNIPNSVTSIGANAFRNCNSLASVNIPNSITAINHETFAFCSNLTSVTIPNSVTSIGGSAFEYCTNLTNVTIPNSVTTIEGVSFGNCGSLTSVVIPNSVTKIGYQVFANCSNLTSVTLPDNIIISESSDAYFNDFEGCTNLTSVTIPKGFTSIYWPAFQKCNSLTSVTIPASVTSIENFVFESCTSLTDVYYGGSVFDWAAVNIGSHNNPLVNANIHFNSTGPSTPSTSSTPSTPSTPSTGAVVSPQKLEVDGSNIDCEKYNIGGSNYFKLRDLAYLLNGTAAQFGVGFDAATSTVTITTGKTYTPAGGELVAGVDNSATAQPSRQAILIDGVKHDNLTAYNIGGSNFFQLRELGNILGFKVDFDTASNTAIIRSAQK